MSIYDIYNYKLIDFISNNRCDLSNSNLNQIDHKIFALLINQSKKEIIAIVVVSL